MWTNKYGAEPRIMNNIDKMNKRLWSIRAEVNDFLLCYFAMGRIDFVT